MGDCQNTPVLGGMLQVLGVTLDKKLQLYSCFFPEIPSLLQTCSEDPVCFLWCLKGL